MNSGGIAFDDAAGRTAAGKPQQETLVTWQGPPLPVTAYVKVNSCDPSTVQFFLEMPAEIEAQRFGAVTIYGTGMPSASYPLTYGSRIPWTAQTPAAPAAVTGWWSPEITPSGTPAILAIKVFTREFEAGVVIPVTPAQAGQVIPPVLPSWVGACGGTRTVCVRRLNTDGSPGPLPVVPVSAVRWLQGTPAQGKFARHTN